MAERITCYCRKHSSPFKRILLFAFRSLFFLYRKLLIFWWPVDSLSAAVRFYMKSKRLIEEQGITHIIAISFPGETMLAAKWLKRKYKEKIKIILYPLDITICGRASSKGIERYLNYSGSSPCPCPPVNPPANHRPHQTSRCSSNKVFHTIVISTPSTVQALFQA